VKEKACQVERLGIADDGSEQAGASETRVQRVSQLFVANVGTGALCLR